MTQEINEFLFTGLIAVGIGAGLTYLFLKSSMVNRKELSKAKEAAAVNQNHLDTKIAVENELRQSMQHLNDQIAQEKDSNKIQAHGLTTLKANLISLQDRLDAEQQVNGKQQVNIETSQSQIQQLKTDIARIETIKSALQEKIDQQSLEFEEARKKSLLEFENIANRLFEEKTTKFSKQSTENIEQLLSPLKENLKDFKKQVQETYDKESKQRFSLEDRIKELVELNQQISKEANNLTKALKGQAKTQGDWGEMILENILEHSGLVKNREYFVQASFKDEAGKLKQPDVKIKYPDDRYIFIDSKVSLTAYERFANSEDIDEQKIYLLQHVKSIKNHIDNLSSKNYDAFDKTLDFVMLFVPIEPAFMTALQYDQELWTYAYKKRVLLISPTNLIAALKMVADIWKREKQNTNAIEIAKRGEKLYDKFVGFVSDMEDIDKHLGKASEKYTDAMNKLSSGKGNLIGQAEKLKQLGVHSKKEIPAKFLSDNPE